MKRIIVDKVLPFNLKQIILLKMLKAVVKCFMFYCYQRNFGIKSLRLKVWIQNGMTRIILKVWVRREKNEISDKSYQDFYSK